MILLMQVADERPMIIETTTFIKIELSLITFSKVISLHIPIYITMHQGDDYYSKKMNLIGLIATKLAHDSTQYLFSYFVLFLSYYNY